MSTLHTNDHGEPYVLVRLRADPAQVRTSVRREGEWWLYTVASRSAPQHEITYRHRRLKVAMWRALVVASNVIDGIDLGMEWAYEHPQGLLGLRPEIR